MAGGVTTSGANARGERGAGTAGGETTSAVVGSGEGEGASSGSGEGSPSSEELSLGAAPPTTSRSSGLDVLNLDRVGTGSTDRDRFGGSPRRANLSMVMEFDG